jgi:ribokinase
VNAVDTTGAGDTFTGYCLYELLAGAPPYDALRFGSAASALEVAKPGAAETIPSRAEVESFLEKNR